MSARILRQLILSAIVLTFAGVAAAGPAKNPYKCQAIFVPDLGHVDLRHHQAGPPGVRYLSDSQLYGRVKNLLERPISPEQARYFRLMRIRMEADRGGVTWDDVRRVALDPRSTHPEKIGILVHTMI